MAIMLNKHGQIETWPPVAPRRRSRLIPRPVVALLRVVRAVQYLVQLLLRCCMELVVHEVLPVVALFFGLVLCALTLLVMLVLGGG